MFIQKHLIAILGLLAVQPAGSTSPPIKISPAIRFRHYWPAELQQSVLVLQDGLRGEFNRKLSLADASVEHETVLIRRSGSTTSPNRISVSRDGLSPMAIGGRIRNIRLRIDEHRGSWQTMASETIELQQTFVNDTSDAIRVIYNDELARMLTANSEAVIMVPRRLRDGVDDQCGYITITGAVEWPLHIGKAVRCDVVDPRGVVVAYGVGVMSNEALVLPMYGDLDAVRQCIGKGEPLRTVMRGDVLGAITSSLDESVWGGQAWISVKQSIER